MSVYRWVLSGIALVVVRLALNKCLALRAAFARVKNYPGGRVQWIDPFHPLALILGNTFPRQGSVAHYGGKMSLYNEFGSTVFTAVVFPSTRQYIWVADAKALEVIVGDRYTFYKDVRTYDILNTYGTNLISTEDSDWKRHRSVAMSAFNEANIGMVWAEALRVVNEWFQQLDATNGRSDVTLDMVQPMTQATLLVIASAGFGKKLSWGGESSAALPPGCKLPFLSAVVHSANNILFSAIFPDWFYRLSEVIKVPYLSSCALLTRLALQDTHTHMLDLVTSARADIASGKPTEISSAALLRNLVEASMDQDGDSKKLSEGEVISNIFVFLLAGHDTTAHTLCFAFALMAIYQECQQKVFEEILHVWPKDMSEAELAANHKEHLDKLKYTTAFFRETLRLYPAVPRTPKQVSKDTILPGTYFVPGSRQSPSVEGEKFTIPVPAGSVICIDIWALHMNPLYWGEDPEEFKPERFIDTKSYQWPRNAYLPFSGGLRSCIGQRFALAESVCILANVVRRYKLSVPDDIAPMSREEQRKTLLKWTTGITLTPMDARVKLSRRV